MTARILIVDDVPATSRMVETRLEAEYFQIATARDGFAALATARRWQPDLILLDVLMPGIDGLECCRRLKRDPETWHIPVVMITALGASRERVAALEAGADDFLTKPVELATMLARVRSLVRLKRLLDEWRSRGATARALGVAEPAVEPVSVAGAVALVVEDRAAGADIVLRGLAEDAIIGRHVTSGADAVGVALEGCDLIVLSLSLTDDDPLRVAAQLRAADAIQHVPVLLLADADALARGLRAFDLGASDWVFRPIDVNELRARARNQIRRKRYRDRLRADLSHALELAATEPLTGLYNRRYLMRHLEGLLAAAPAPLVAVLMLDLDRFKRVNDEFGHAAGDRALRTIAAALRVAIRASDTLARLGGEEFVVVMPGASAEEALAAGERLRAAVAALPSDRAHGLTVSIGIAVADAAGCDADVVLAAADGALYEAKRAGRDRVRLTRPAEGGKPRPSHGRRASPFLSRAPG